MQNYSFDAYDFIKMLVDILGYKSTVEELGGGIEDYFEIAKKIGLIDEIDTEEIEKSALRGNIALIIYRMLEIPIMEDSILKSFRAM